MRVVSDLVGFAGRHADVYERVIVPGQIRPFADVLTGHSWSGSRLLDLACGAGFVAEVLCGRFCSIIGVDSSSDMAARSPGNVAADARALPFVDSVFDAATCVFGWMFFDSHAAAAGELRRVLHTGSQCLSLVWRPIGENAYPVLAKRIVYGWFPDEPPTYYDIAFDLHASDRAAKYLAKAGFRIERTVVERMGAFTDAAAYAEAFVFGNVKVQRLARQRGLDPRAVYESLARAAALEFGDRPCSAPMRAEAILATA